MGNKANISRDYSFKVILCKGIFSFNVYYILLYNILFAFIDTLTDFEVLLIAKFV